MSLYTAEKVVAYLDKQADLIPPWKQLELNLYGGEPFLNFPVVQYLVENSVDLGVYATIFTNGATATQEQIEWCQENNVSPKRSTGGCPEAAALTRPGDYTERWVNEGRLWGDFASCHRLTVTPDTAPYVARSVRWLHSQGFYGMIDLATDDYAEWPVEAQERFEDEVGWLAAEFVWQFRHGRMLGIENFCQFGKAIFGQSGAMVLGCGAGTTTQAITFDGYITACHRFMREARKSVLCQNTVSDILSGQMVSFGDQLAARIAACVGGVESEECRRCDARQSCQHGCWHVSHVACAGNMERSPQARCRFIRCYAEWTRWIHSQLFAVDPHWWERPSMACRPFSEE